MSYDHYSPFVFRARTPSVAHGRSDCASPMCSLIRAGCRFYKNRLLCHAALHSPDRTIDTERIDLIRKTKIYYLKWYGKHKTEATQNCSASVQHAIMSSVKLNGLTETYATRIWPRQVD